MDIFWQIVLGMVCYPTPIFVSVFVSSVVNSSLPSPPPVLGALQWVRASLGFPLRFGEKNSCPCRVISYPQPRCMIPLTRNTCSRVGFACFFDFFLLLWHCDWNLLVCFCAVWELRASFHSIGPWQLPIPCWAQPPLVTSMGVIPYPALYSWLLATLERNLQTLHNFGQSPGVSATFCLRPLGVPTLCHSSLLLPRFPAAV